MPTSELTYLWYNMFNTCSVISRWSGNAAVGLTRRNNGAARNPRTAAYMYMYTRGGPPPGASLCLALLCPASGPASTSPPTTTTAAAAAAAVAAIAPPRGNAEDLCESIPCVTRRNSDAHFLFLLHVIYIHIYIYRCLYIGTCII